MRETMLVRGPRGWGEFAAFTEYDDIESAPWLASAIEQAWGPEPTAPIVRDVVRFNATLPAVAPDRVAEILGRFSDVRTVKVKVAEPGQTLADDVARVAAARAYVGDEGRIRVDANGGWNVDEAEHAIRALERFDLEYVEQPCASVEELAEIRRRVHDMGILIAADESVRKAADPLAVARAGAADILVIKVAPLGGVQRSLDIIAEAGLPVVISSALESSIGLVAGLDLARRVPQLPFDCGLDTASLFVNNGEPVSADREAWWRERAVRCLAILANS
jgi:O-succinylbenzoate synthase